MDAVSPKILCFDAFTLDLMRCALLRGEEELSLRPKSFDVLRHLVEHAGRVVSKDELMAAIWPGTHVTDDSLVQCIRDIRQALGDDDHRIVKTVPRRGYRFAAEVTRTAANVAPSTPAAAPAPIGEAPTPSQPVPGARYIGWRQASLIVAGLLIVLLGTGTWAVWNRFIPGTPAVSPVSSAPSIAVLPFKYLGDGPAEENPADLLVDDITTELSRARGAFVISRRSTAIYKNRPLDPKAIARELGVRYVVLGSMRGEGDGFRVNVQLVEAEHGRQLWAEPFDYPRAGGAEAQNRIVARIARTLGVELVNAEARRPPPRHPDAAHLSDQGHWIVNNERNAKANKEAIEKFEAALALDSDWVPALLGSATANLGDVLNSWIPRSERPIRVDRAAERVERTIKLDPKNPEAHYLRGRVLRTRGELEQAISAFEYAIELNPNFAQAHAELGRVKIDVGRANETVRHVEVADRLSPHDPTRYLWYFWAGQAALLAGDDEAAVFCLVRARQANRAYTTSELWLAIAYELLGRKDEARAFMLDVLARKPDLAISTWDNAYPRRHPIFVKQHARIDDALRRLGVPE
jgi:TolB-like protein/DNA-binding winged helix-turn-helix (wHTH) protein